MKIVGVSFDQPQFNLQFRQNENFQYALWSDTNREMAGYYGADYGPLVPFPKRMSVVLDPEGIWRLIYPLPEEGVGGLYAHAQLILDDLGVLTEL